MNHRSWLIAAYVLLCWCTATIAAQARLAIAVFHAGVFLLAIAWMMLAARRGHMPRFGIALGLLAVPLLYSLIQQAAGLALYPHATWTAALSWTAMLFLAFLLRQWLVDAENRRLFLSLFMASGFLLAFYVLLQPFLGEFHLAGFIPVRTEDMAGPFQNRNTYASFIELALPVAIWMALADSRRAWICWAGAGIMVASVVATASRAGTLLLLAEILVVLAIAAARRLAPPKKLLLAGAQLSAMAVFWAALAGWETLWTRLQFSDPFIYRRDIYASAIQMFFEKPWTGFGLGSFEAAYPPFARFDVGRIVNFVHNDWLQWALEGGIPTVTAMALLALWCLYSSWGHLWGIGTGFVFLHALVDYPLQRPGLAAWMFAVIAALAAANDIRTAHRARRPDAASLKLPSDPEPPPPAPSPVARSDRSSTKAAR
jgi:O-antigen ligase